MFTYDCELVNCIQPMVIGRQHHNVNIILSGHTSVAAVTQERR